MKSGTMTRRAVSRMLTVLLAAALFISMMPLGLGSVFAADPADYQPVLTITKPDGTVVSYQTVEEAVTAFGGSITDDTSFGLALEGIAVKRLLKDY